MKKKDDFTLVLGGGGTKGSYQMGAWKALRENKFSIQAVSGASVGALNAALFAQGSYDLAEEIWEKIRLEDVVEVPDKLIKKGKLSLTPLVLSDFKLLKTVWAKGLDSTPLKNLIKQYVNEEAIRKSEIDLGVVTINLSQLKPLEIFLDQMEKGYLADYLLASATLPIFKNTSIQGKNFLDGGFHDNIPFAMMKNRGYKRFLIVDVSGPGNNRRPQIAGTETIYIKNSIDMGGILDFDPKFIHRYRLLGYLDTQKIMGHNQGVKYFYTHSPKIEARLRALLGHPEVRKTIRDYGGKAAQDNIRTILPKDYKTIKDPLLSLAECAALALRLERVELYQFDDFISLIYNSWKLTEQKAPPVEKNHFKDFFGYLSLKIKEINPEKMLNEYSPQEYLKASEILIGERMSALEKQTLLKIFPELPGAQVFFAILKVYFKGK